MACADPIENHYRLVTFVAKRFRNIAMAKGETFDDVVQSGYIGLIKAHRNSEPTMNVRFATYAVPMIVGSIQNHFRDYVSKVYIPRPIRDYVDRIHRLGLHGESAESIAMKFNIPLRWAKRTLAALHACQTYSLDAPVYEAENDRSVSLIDRQVCESDYSHAVVEDFILTLTEKDRRILRLAMDGKLQREIGAIVGTSQVNVSRSLKRIGTKLKAYLG